MAFVKRDQEIQTVVLANFEVADKLGVASLLSIPMSAFFGCAGGGFLCFLSQSRGASARDSCPSAPAQRFATVCETTENEDR
jgi:hypothetical protein